MVRTCARVWFVPSTFWGNSFGAQDHRPLDGECASRIAKCLRKPEYRAARAQMLDKELIILAINARSGTHWVTGCINLKCRRFEIFDSLLTYCAATAASAAKS